MGRLEALARGMEARGRSLVRGEATGGGAVAVGG